MRATALRVAPFVSKKRRSRSTIVSPRQLITKRSSAVTVATVTASRFSPLASAMKRSTSSGATTTAMRSCDSLVASSTPSSPSYLRGTRSKSIESPRASSPTATHTPPAPKSLQRLISEHTSFERNKRCILRSSTGLPF